MNLRGPLLRPPFSRLATANIAFIFFLALRHTPLAYLTSWTYERLNVLHQIAGYTTVLLSVLHTMCVIIISRIQTSTEKCTVYSSTPEARKISCTTSSPHCKSPAS